MNYSKSLISLNNYVHLSLNSTRNYSSKYIFNSLILGPKCQKFSSMQQLAAVIPLKCDYRGFRSVYRRPIGVVHKKKTKTVDDYVEESSKHSAEILNDETDVARYQFERGDSHENINRLEADHHHQVFRNMEASDENLSEKSIGKKKHKNKLNGSQFTKKSFPGSNVSLEKMEEDIATLDFSKKLKINMYSEANKKVKSLFELSKSTRSRRKKNIFMLEGWRLIAEALKRDLKPQAVFISRSHLLLNMKSLLNFQSEDQFADYLNAFPLYKTPYNTFKLWSPLETPPGIMAAFPLSDAVDMTSEGSFPGVSPSVPVTVVLDQVRDPNNLGSLLRTLASAGVQQVVLMKGCCDMWDLKVLRSSSGAHFCLKCVSGVRWSDISELVTRPTDVFLADAHPGGDLSTAEMDNEQKIPDDEFKVTLDDFGTTDLNNELKSLEDEFKVNLDAKEDESNDGSSLVYEVDDEGNRVSGDLSYDDEFHLRQFESVQLQKRFYDNVPFFRDDSTKSIVLVIGGETGLSPAAKKFALENEGLQLSIPMENGFDSLNTAVATGILVYEIKKQYKKLFEQNIKIRTKN